MVPIRLMHGGNSLDTVGLVDSGADISAMPKGFADILGIDLTDKQETIGGIGGKTGAIKTTLDVAFHIGHETVRMNLPIYVVLDEKNNFPFLLGRGGFFNLFDITFKENEKRVVFKKLSPQPRPRW